MSDVFVSYKAEDRRRVKPLVEALQADGYAVWWDEQIGGGAAWRHEIEAELNAAKCVIVAWSKRSVGPEGTFVQDEATRAQQRHVYIPVLIDKVHLPLGFGEMQALPLTGWKGNRADPRYQAVLTAVRRIAGGETREAGLHKAAHAPVSRRAVIAGGGAAAAAVAGVGGWLLLKPGSTAASDSIAVLPFANLSGDPGQAYFSDGIAEELRSALARLAGLKVVGRTSSEAVRDDDAQTAAKKLRVANVLTGSVRRSPSTVRVSAQLIDGRNGLERWSSSYDRSPGDSIKIQTDIAENVARALRIALGSAGRAVLTVGGTQIAAAQNLYLEADQLSYEGGRDNLERSQQLLDQALALDPRYAQAYALKAILRLLTVNQFARSPSELTQGKTEALRLAKQSIRLAPGLPIGHGALALIHQSNLQIAPALAEHKRAYTLASGEPDAVRGYGSFLSRMGRASQAIRLADRALALDPLNSFSYSHRAAILFDARRYADCVSSLEDLKRSSPQLFSAPVTLGNGLMMLGRTEDSRRSYAEAAADSPFRLVGEAVLAARGDDRSGALRKADQIRKLYGEAASYQYGEIHAQLGEPDEALAHLERAWEIKDAGMVSMRVDPWLDPIRKQPRFAALMTKMNFPG